MALISSYAPGKPCWLDIMVNDTEARESLMSFCADVFGWTYDVGGEESGYYTVALLNGVPVAGLGQMEGSAGQWATYLATNDIDATVTRATELGANVFFPTIDVWDQGRMALATDPTGAVFGMWQQVNFLGTGAYGEAGAPSWHNHASGEAKKAADIYRDLFPGVQVVGADGFFMLNVEGEHAFASVAPNMTPFPAHWQPVIGTTSLVETEAKVKAAGGTILASNQPVMGGAISVFSDPKVGSVLTVFQPSP